MIKHIWFDFSQTIAGINKEEHNKLRYDSYAGVVGKLVSAELKTEFDKLYVAHQHSNAAVFRSLGCSSNFWSERVNSVDPARFYTLMDERIPDILQQIRAKVPISIFSNIELATVLPALNIEPTWFTYTLSAGMVKEPKPALDGFHKLVALSQIPPAEILYVGDDVGKDVLPAKKVGLKTGIVWKTAPEADYSFRNFNEILAVVSHKENK